MLLFFFRCKFCLLTSKQHQLDLTTSSSNKLKFGIHLELCLWPPGEYSLSFRSVLPFYQCRHALLAYLTTDLMTPVLNAKVELNSYSWSINSVCQHTVYNSASVWQCTWHILISLWNMMRDTNGISSNWFPKLKLKCNVILLPHEYLKMGLCSLMYLI